MIFIEYAPVYSRISGVVPKDVHSDLYNLLSFEVQGAMYSNSYLSNQWDGYKRYYSLKTHSFKSGLLLKVLDYFTKNGLEYQVNNFPQLQRFEKRGEYEPRPYQNPVLDVMFSSARGIIKSPPRSGKTIIAGAFLDQSRLFPNIFLCNSIDIASQTLQKFRSMIPDCSFGLIGDGIFDIGDITVMTVQSAVMAYEDEYKSRRAKKREEKGKPYKSWDNRSELTNDQRLELREHFLKAKSVMYDECHHSQSSTANLVMSKAKNAQAIFGFSATPGYGTESDLQIEATIGSIIHEISYHDLIRGGYLLPPKIFVYNIPKTVCSSTMYPAIYSEAIVHNEFRNRLIAKLAQRLISKKKTVLVIVDKKVHGNNIKHFLPEAFILYGDASLEERNMVKEELNSGELLCVISTLWDEGVDIPGLHYVINAAGGASPIDTFQRLRSITPNPDDPDKKFGGLIDFVSKERYLKSHYNFRLSQYQSEPDFEIIPKDIHKWTIQDVKLWDIGKND